MKKLRSATKEDHWAMQVFLRQANISTMGLEDKIENFIILEEEEQGICGTIGIEKIERDGLLRSLVIGPSVNQMHLLQMFEHTQQHARRKELDRLYLVTNKQDYIQFFELLGFHPQEVHNVPTEITESEHLKETMEQHTCTFMMCKL
ncbi:GNAT family N-acetyltransferase [Sutcliffiella deserti]|uniref:GNAT family N-acetyltransferase n=1 Tax=Sutcliffiella deserti TaxID=2875501 RepID=UPI001CC01D91|nr:hypothetical protein [Sutcliffiella deserti]